MTTDELRAFERLTGGDARAPDGRRSRRRCNRSPSAALSARARDEQRGKSSPRSSFVGRVIPCGLHSSPRYGRQSTSGGRTSRASETTATRPVFCTRRRGASSRFCVISVLLDGARFAGPHRPDAYVTTSEVCRVAQRPARLSREGRVVKEPKPTWEHSGVDWAPAEVIRGGDSG